MLPTFLPDILYLAGTSDYLLYMHTHFEILTLYPPCHYKVPLLRSLPIFSLFSCFSLVEETSHSFAIQTPSRLNQKKRMKITSLLIATLLGVALAEPIPWEGNSNRGVYRRNPEAKAEAWHPRAGAPLAIWQKRNAEPDPEADPEADPWSGRYLTILDIQ